MSQISNAAYKSFAFLRIIIEKEEEIKKHEAEKREFEKQFLASFDLAEGTVMYEAKSIYQNILTTSLNEEEKRERLIRFFNGFIKEKL